MNKIIIVLLIITVSLAAGCAEELPTPIKQDALIIKELNYILDFVEDETAQQTIEILTKAPVIIDKDFLEIVSSYDSTNTYVEEVLPYEEERSLNYAKFINTGNYNQYSVRYKEDHKDGSLQVVYLTVFVEVDEERDPLMPLHAYAYNRTMEKQAGILEPFTPLRWFNSFIEVGGRDESELEIIMGE